jgi:D-alanyl-D-alanine carboxypeptidase/D-alanyl-D-alanine-endopeptidase (penicillin-binding protein 4)
LKKNNRTKINGTIVIDSSRFKAPDYANGVTYDDLGWYYTAPNSAVMLNENAEVYDVSANKLGMPVTLKSKIPERRLNLINQVITVSKDQEKNHCTLNVEILSANTVRLFGCMAQNKNPKEIQLAIPDPVLLAKQIIKKTLAQNNILFKGKIIEGTTPPDAHIIALYQSDDITKLVTHMLKESDNLYANSLTKQLGFSLTKEGSYKQGAFAIKKILSEHTNLDMSQIELSDGMGTRYNLATPKQIVLLLTNLYNNKTLRPIIINALPQSGLSGTLKDRMKKTSLEKIVFAKTGTMHDISSLSGYIINPKDRTLIFSIVINGVNKPISTAKALEEHILLTIMKNISTEPEVLNDYG